MAEVGDVLKVPLKFAATSLVRQRAFSSQLNVYSKVTPVRTTMK